MRRGPWMLALCAILVLLATLVPPAVRLGWHLQGHTAVVPEAIIANQPQTAAPPPIGTDNILAFAPFGDPVQPEAPAAAPARSRDLEISLRGVLVAEDAAESRALIAVSGGIDRFRIGDALTEGVVLTAIQPAVVEVEIDGTPRLYGFDGLLEEGTEESGSDAAPAGESPLDRLRAAIVPGRGSLDLREAPPPESTQDYIDLWRQRIIDDPQAVLDTIGLVAGDGGYTIAENPNVGVTLAGLKPGDLVTRVNGQDVGDPQQDRAFYDEVAASGQARLEVVRNGEKLLMSFPLR